MLMKMSGSSHSFSDSDWTKLKVIKAAYIKHNHITYCMNTGDVLITTTTTSSWTGGLSGMPEDPCKHNYWIVNKGFDDQFEICKKCGERK